MRRIWLTSEEWARIVQDIEVLRQENARLRAQLEEQDDPKNRK